jgi:prepilin-type N-terminal cleavage/methylation domain-containing protein
MPNHIRTKLELQRRRARRGFSLIEVVVAIAIIAMVSGGVVVAVMKHQAESQKKMTKVNAAAIRNGVKSWWIDHQGSECPDVKVLVADGLIDRGKGVKQDAWGQPWKIVCENQEATVISRGPDRTPDTEDDIRVPSDI